MKKNYFKDFDMDDAVERIFKFAIIGWVIGMAAVVAVWVALIWVAIHFIAKFW